MKGAIWSVKVVSDGIIDQKIVFFGKPSSMTNMDPHVNSPQGYR